ncbi:MAG: hypothetical protein SVV03_01310 [Candidatus Nanohaloarchaea archaeon]|nr:hypothetical protein [Candidatus Nanohaloarchaea archaeon]
MKPSLNQHLSIELRDLVFLGAGLLIGALAVSSSMAETGISKQKAGEFAAEYYHYNVEQNNNSIISSELESVSETPYFSLYNVTLSVETIDGKTTRSFYVTRDGKKLLDSEDIVLPFRYTFRGTNKTVESLGKE